MTLIPTGDSLITLTFNNGGAPRPAQCTFGVNHPGSLSPLETCELVRDTDLDTLMAAVSVDDCVITNIHCKQGPNDDGGFADLAVSIAGNQASDSPPSMAALNVVKITAAGGRRGRGRMFWPGFPENSLNDNGAFNSGALTQYNDAFEAWRAAMDTADATLVLLHQTAPSAHNDITAFSVQSRPVTQRRRNRRAA